MGGEGAGGASAPNTMDMKAKVVGMKIRSQMISRKVLRIYQKCNMF